MTPLRTSHDMKAKNPQARALAIAGAATAQLAPAADSPTLPPEFTVPTSKDDKARTEAWQRAAALGPAAIKSLAELLNHEDTEVVRAAKRALWKIVHTAGNPGSDALKASAVAELLPLLTSDAAVARREALWMLSEIGGDESVAPVARLLSDKEVRDDARAALQRIPGDKAMAALEAALATAPEEFRPQIAQSLRRRGIKVNGYPSQNLRPTKVTSLKAQT